MLWGVWDLGCLRCLGFGCLVFTVLTTFKVLRGSAKLEPHHSRQALTQRLLSRYIGDTFPNYINIS